MTLTLPSTLEHEDLLPIGVPVLVELAVGVVAHLSYKPYVTGDRGDKA